MEPVERKNGKKLETLPVVICDDEEKVVGIVDLPDPREKYIAEYNERCEVRGRHAKVA